MLIMLRCTCRHHTFTLPSSVGLSIFSNLKYIFKNRFFFLQRVLQWLCSTIGILSLVPFFNPRTGCSRLLKITEYFFFVFLFSNLFCFFEFEGLLVNLMLCSCQRPQGSRNLASHVLKVTLSRLL